VEDDRTIMSITCHPKGNGLIIRDKYDLPAVVFVKGDDGGTVGVFNKDGKVAALMSATPLGGMVGIVNKDKKLVASMGVHQSSGFVWLYDNDGKFVWGAP